MERGRDVCGGSVGCGRSRREGEVTDGGRSRRASEVKTDGGRGRKTDGDRAGSNTRVTEPKNYAR